MYFRVISIEIMLSILIFNKMINFQSCQAIDSFLRGVYINVGEILNSDWLKSYIYFPYMPNLAITPFCNLIKGVE
jgi:hypothetical protein